MKHTGEKDYPHVQFVVVTLDIKYKRVTKVWSVKSKAGDKLGMVKWWAHWRRYCFFPRPAPAYADDLLFDAGCLWDIADFIAMKTRERKEERKTK